MKVPVISLRGDGLGFAAELGKAFEEQGFAVLTDHGLSHELMARMYEVKRRLFAFTDEQLARYEDKMTGQYGFFPFQREHAADQPADRADLKRMWHIFRPDENPNVWPTDEVPDFRLVMEEIYYRLDQLSFRLLAGLDAYLGEGTNELVEMAKGGRTLFRSIHYPTVKGGVAAGVVRSAQHTDINLITLLIAATAGGLEVQNLNGQWFPVQEVPDSIVCNVGDMLKMFTARRTDRRLTSTVHRVVNPVEGDESDRYSAPFFVHPRSEVVLDRPTGYTAGQYLAYRLVEIGLLNGDLAGMAPPPVIDAV